jgi:hypothetical protein
MTATNFADPMESIAKGVEQMRYAGLVLNRFESLPRAQKRLEVTIRLEHHVHTRPNGPGRGRSTLNTGLGHGPTIQAEAHNDGAGTVTKNCSIELHMPPPPQPGPTRAPVSFPENCI